MGSPGQILRESASTGCITNFPCTNCLDFVPVKCLMRQFNCSKKPSILTFEFFWWPFDDRGMAPKDWEQTWASIVWLLHLIFLDCWHPVLKREKKKENFVLTYYNALILSSPLWIRMKLNIFICHFSVNEYWMNLPIEDCACMFYPYYVHKWQLADAKMMFRRSTEHPKMV